MLHRYLKNRFFLIFQCSPVSIQTGRELVLQPLKFEPKRLAGFYTTTDFQKKDLTWEASLFQPIIQGLGIGGLLHSGLLRDVESVKELPDILVLHCGRLLDQSSGLRHGFNGVALQTRVVNLITSEVLYFDYCNVERYSPARSARPSATCCSQLWHRGASSPLKENRCFNSILDEKLHFRYILDSLSHLPDEFLSKEVTDLQEHHELNGIEMCWDSKLEGGRHQPTSIRVPPSVMAQLMGKCA